MHIRSPVRRLNLSILQSVQTVMPVTRVIRVQSVTLPINLYIYSSGLLEDVQYVWVILPVFVSFLNTLNLPKIAVFFLPKQIIFCNNGHMVIWWYIGWGWRSGGWGDWHSQDEILIGGDGRGRLWWCHTELMNDLNVTLLWAGREQWKWTDEQIYGRFCLW